MNPSQWQALNPDQLPECPAVYAILWRRKWLYVGSSDNLKLSLDSQPLPYRIALGLTDARLLWMPSSDPRRQGAKLQQMMRCQWQGLADGLTSGNTPQCAWPAAHRLDSAVPMVARPLTNVLDALRVEVA
ncbi:MAG: hypothetical protein HC824_21945 [Synechococcales cyanobacterium RM1_1_8]|nr:hypothetical protein [Synechococcales cyanobacterium RM1_1_8]